MFRQYTDWQMWRRTRTRHRDVQSNYSGETSEFKGTRTNVEFSFGSNFAIFSVSFSDSKWLVARQVLVSNLWVTLNHSPRFELILTLPTYAVVCWKVNYNSSWAVGIAVCSWSALRGKWCSLTFVVWLFNPHHVIYICAMCKRCNATKALKYKLVSKMYLFGWVHL